MSSTEIHSILGQSDSVKELYSVRKQALEPGQQLMTQQIRENKKQEKEKLRQFEPEERMEGEKEEEGDGEDRQKGKEQSDQELSPSEGTLIDIRI